MDKLRLREAVIEKLKGELEMITRAALMARDEATHEESKPENKYDMHAQEAAYLAEGQAKLAAELNESLNLFLSLPTHPWPQGTAAGIGAFITLEAKGKSLFFLLGPRSGGVEIDFEGKVVTVITPASPLGRQLVGCKVGDVVKLPSRMGPIPHSVLEIK